MEFAILIIINIFLGTVFYLVISLKLEKSASEFREKKLRKFMDDIINEFNETAERNISILENKIMVMKNLMERMGDVKSIDIKVDDPIINTCEISKRVEQSDVVNSVEANKGGRIDSKEKSFHPGDLVEGGGIILNKLTDRLNFTREKAVEIFKSSIAGVSNYLQNMRGRYVRSSKIIKDRPLISNSSEYRYFNEDAERRIDSDNVGSNFNVLIERDYNEIHEMLSVDSDDGLYCDMDEEELAGLFLTSEDKYSLISDLYLRGCTINVISKCSGIPVGEIKLVLNLNNP